MGLWTLGFGLRTLIFDLEVLSVAKAHQRQRPKSKAPRPNNRACFKTLATAFLPDVATNYFQGSGNRRLSREV
jgi:hypothetical protein